MKLTLLGTGTSQGVPVIGCHCAVCRSLDPRDRRLRTSAMVEWQGCRFVIDAGPDFRQQLLRSDVAHLDAILLTHEHKDHIGGLDDVRALNFVDFPNAVHPVDIYATERTLNCVRKDFDYAFAADKYRGVPEIRLHAFERRTPFRIGGVEVIPIAGEHSSRFEVTGFRFGKMAYLTDFKTIDDQELAKLQGLELLVINALRFEHHVSHFNLEEALAVAERVKPHRTVLTHMSHEMGCYAETNARLPEGVELGYDQMEIVIED